MAAAFLFVFMVFGVATLFVIRGYFRIGRAGKWIVNPYLPVVILVMVFGSYLVAKIVYEEVYPCVAVDDFYCDFSSTQYKNLFGWEF